MAFEYVVPVVVKTIFSTVGERLFGSRQGRPVERNPLFGPTFIELARRNQPAPPPVLSAAPTPGINPTAPAPSPLPTGGDLFEDLLRRPSPGIGTRNPPPTGNPDFERILRGPPSDFERIMRGTYRPPDVRTPVTVARAGSLAGILARAAGLLGGLLYPSPLGDSDLGYKAGGSKKRPPKGPKRRFRRQREPKPPRLLPWPYAQSIPDRTGRRPEPSPAAPLPVQIALPFPLPTPSPSARPRPSTAPVPTTSPVGQTSGPLQNPLVFPLPFPFKFPTRLPRIPTVSPLAPLASGISNRIPRFDSRPLTGSQPRDLPSVLTASAPGCPPCGDARGRRSGKKRKPRTVCYRGEYVEKANGLTKFRKRKIPCR